jgi:hypothetical protein
MKKKVLFLTLLGVMAFRMILLGDSPLTSTEFNRPYSADPAVIEAGNGVLTPTLAKFLTDGRNPIDLRMAVINGLGWNTEGTVNDSLFLEYLKESRGYKDLDDLLERGSADELLCIAYLAAMADYFDVTLATQIAEKAVSKNPDSYTFNIICALIKAQTKLTEFDWCEVYNLTNRVREDSSLVQDMKPEAVARIFEYMDPYHEYCLSPDDRKARRRRHQNLK